MHNNEHSRFMAATIRFARTHLGLCGSNPSVGALIVKDGVIVGRGVTATGGRPHAETQALKEAGHLAKGATAYVTLEPCAHYGHTPPCANALIEAGVAQVVIAHPDPDPRVRGKGVSMLKNADIEVIETILKDQAYEGLSAYLTEKIKKRPEVTLKMAISKDGMIGKMSGQMVSITHEVSKSMTHMMRAQSDAIMIGSNTANNDDPELTCRLSGLENRSPIRIIVDSQLSISPTSKLCQTAHKTPLFIMTASGYNKEKSHKLTQLGCKIFECRDNEGRLDLKSMLEQLSEKGIKSVLIEGGATLAAAFLNAGLIDRVFLFTSETIIGEGGVPAPVLPDFIPKGFRFKGLSHLQSDQCYEFLKD
jgi:diaminohydroxyphosphoribosylaminopyrimidine deaminase / 5-amino-6-(5-phosphoribosylamino)uracil reductase